MSETDGSHAAEIDFDALRSALDSMQLQLQGREELSAERRREVLAARAKAIAGARTSEVKDEITALAFRVGGERYALPLSELAIVLDGRGLHPLAGAPRWLLGAMVARSRLVPVIDLRQLLRLEGGGMSDLGTIVVMESDGEAFGVAVEALEGHVALPRACLDAAAGGPVRHVTADRMAVLDPAALVEAAAALG